MKKIYPSLVIVAIFGVLMVLQMVVHGQKLTANKIENHVERFSAFENEYEKLVINTTKGSKYDLDKLESPIVILNFWASWCTPCVAEFASLNKLIEKYPGKVKVIGINNDDDDALKKVKKMEKKYKLKFESTLDTSGKIAANFKITKIPASIVYFKGKIINFSNQEFNFMQEDFLSKIDSKLKL